MSVPTAKPGPLLPKVMPSSYRQTAKTVHEIMGVLPYPEEEMKLREGLNVDNMILVWSKKKQCYQVGTVVGVVERDFNFPVAIRVGGRIIRKSIMSPFLACPNDEGTLFRSAPQFQPTLPQSKTNTLQKDHFVAADDNEDSGDEAEECWSRTEPQAEREPELQEEDYCSSVWDAETGELRLTTQVLVRGKKKARQCLPSLMRRFDGWMDEEEVFQGMKFFCVAGVFDLPHTFVETDEGERQVGRMTEEIMLDEASLEILRRVVEVEGPQFHAASVPKLLGSALIELAYAEYSPERATSNSRPRDL